MLPLQGLAGARSRGQPPSAGVGPTTGHNSGRQHVRQIERQDGRCTAVLLPPSSWVKVFKSSVAPFARRCGGAQHWPSKGEELGALLRLDGLDASTALHDAFARARP